MHRMITIRDNRQDQRFFDIHFIPFQRDPLTSIAGLYGFLGEELTPETRARMEAWRRSKPLEEQGYVRTVPAEFGLDLAELRRSFEFYTDRFDVSRKEAVRF